MSIGLLMGEDRRLKQAKDIAAANMTADAVAAKMSPEEAKRLSRVRNIGIAVREAPAVQANALWIGHGTDDLRRRISTQARRP